MEPCGRCNPCRYTAEEGLSRRIPPRHAAARAVRPAAAKSAKDTAPLSLPDKLRRVPQCDRYFRPAVADSPIESFGNVRSEWTASPFAKAGTVDWTNRLFYAYAEIALTVWEVRETGRAYPNRLPR